MGAGVAPPVVPNVKLTGLLMAGVVPLMGNNVGVPLIKFMAIAPVEITGIMLMVPEAERDKPKGNVTKTYGC
jgi:hypothetical protein